MVLAGKDRGKSGTVLRAFPKKDRVLVEGIAIVKKHQKARRSGSLGQIIEKPMPIHISNLSLLDPTSHKPSRMGVTVAADGSKQRVAVKSKAVISQ